MKYKIDEVEKYSKQLEILNPKAVLSRGYSISLSKNGKPIKSVKDLKKDDEIITVVEDGEFLSQVKEIKGE